MGYFEPVSIGSTLERIQNREYVLPAIQRDFVWNDRQIANLFDSLMRGYPIGSLLSWTVQPGTIKNFKFYELMRDYNELTNPHCHVLDIPTDRTVRAVLDGQQRLTAFNIGLRGSYADRKPGGWRSNPSAYPKRRLFLNLLSKAPENDDDREYDFRMLSDAMLQGFESDDRFHWFPVHIVFDNRGRGIWTELTKRGVLDDAQPMEWLDQLRDAVHSRPLLYFYDEDSQDIDRVLDIFIRVNSGGTKLSHSDLLMSIATAQWTERDAREEINDLVTTVNAAGDGFAFSKDNVLKAGLVLIDVTDIGFKVKNFNTANMDRLQKNWDEVSAALTTAAGLLGDFGMSESTLSAHSVLTPIAYYLHQNGYSNDAYRTSTRFESDRQKIKRWVLRSLIKPGIWGSGLDTLLRELRSVIQRDTTGSFPARALAAAMDARGKSLDLSDAEVDNLLTASYGRPTTFATLAILFPHVNTRNIHHVDHIYPKSELTRAKLKKAGIDDETVERITRQKDELPNLMLLEGGVNMSKSAKSPAAWIRAQGDQATIASLRTLHRLPDALPENQNGFDEFFTRRSQALRALIKQQLGGSAD